MLENSKYLKIQNPLPVHMGFLDETALHPKPQICCDSRKPNLSGFAWLCYQIFLKNCKIQSRLTLYNWVDHTRSIWPRLLDVPPFSEKKKVFFFKQSKTQVEIVIIYLHQYLNQLNAETSLQPCCMSSFFSLLCGQRCPRATCKKYFGPMIFYFFHIQ